MPLSHLSVSSPAAGASLVDYFLPIAGNSPGYAPSGGVPAAENSHSLLSLLPGLGEDLADSLTAPPLTDLDAPPAWWELEGISQPFPCGKWSWRNDISGETRPFRCGSWRCPVCAYATARKWTTLLFWAGVERHIVITRLAGSALGARARLQNIIKALRRGEGVELRRGRRVPRVFEYFATAERHSSAGIHTHILQKGHYLDQALTSTMCERYGAGKIFWVESIAGDAAALRRYVVRHLIQFEHPHQPKVGHRIRYSRAFFGEGSARSIWQALHPSAPGWELLKSPVHTRSPEPLRPPWINTPPPQETPPCS